MKSSAAQEKSTSSTVRIDGRRISLDAYHARVERVHDRVRRHRLTKTHIAREIRRSRPHVSAVLHGRHRGPGTLVLIEALLADIEAQGKGRR